MYGEMQIRTTWKDFDFYSFEENSLEEIIQAVTTAYEEYEQDPETIAYRQAVEQD